MSASPTDHYQTHQIMTASPAMLVFMLYDKAICCLREAVRAIEAGDIEARWKANGRAMEIVEHLRMTLNMDAGGEIAANLDQIYGRLLLELPKVDLKNDPERAREAIKLLEPLRESWRVLAGSGEEATRQAAQAASSKASAQAASNKASAQAASATSPAAAPSRPAPAQPRGDAARDANPPPRRITLSA